MSTNRCCKQMLGRSSHTYRVIVGAENSSVRNAGVPLFSKPEAATTKRSFYRGGVATARVPRIASAPQGDRKRRRKKAILTCGGREGGAGAEKGG